MLAEGNALIYTLLNYYESDAVLILEMFSCYIFASIIRL